MEQIESEAKSPPLSHGIARELRKQQSILECEIAQLEQG